jgi:glycosyltransferase involved in cell wall biosynthesis
VRAKSIVLPVGCDLARLDDRRRGGAPPAKPRPNNAPILLWNQRWEYDKAPEVFLEALDVLVEEGIAFRVILAGGNVRQKAAEFEAARVRLGERVIHYGWADAATYARLLWEADAVVSTALHEFFGIAIVEALYCGCFPILPRRLAYPEVLPARYHDACMYDDFEGLMDRLRWALTCPDEAQQACQGLAEEMAMYDWSAVAPRYDAHLSELARRPL